jgi:hypothetical protein
VVESRVGFVAYNEGISSSASGKPAIYIPETTQTSPQALEAHPPGPRRNVATQESMAAARWSMHRDKLITQVAVLQREHMRHAELYRIYFHPGNIRIHGEVDLLEEHIKVLR